MSWDAHLSAVVDDNEIEVGDWGYTHNTNVMISTALEEIGAELTTAFFSGGKPTYWYKAIDGKTGKEAEPMFAHVISAIEADPQKYRAMNPPNGWGDMNSLLDVLREMLAACRKFPSAKWSIS